jgi:co-chaperonin GroES (HSP10)
MSHSTLPDPLVGAILQTDIPSLEHRRVRVRPTGKNVLVERQNDSREYKGLIVPTADRYSCQVARVIAVGPDVDEVKIGQDAIFVRSIGRKVDDRELRSSAGRKVWLMEQKDIVAVVDEGSRMLAPTAKRVLIRLPDDRRELPSGLVIFQGESLLVVVSEVLGLGPKASSEVHVGDKVIHHKVEPLQIDDPWLIDRFGARLGVLGHEEMCRAVVEYAEGEEGQVRITGHGYGVQT